MQLIQIPVRTDSAERSLFQMKILAQYRSATSYHSDLLLHLRGCVVVTKLIVQIELRS